MRLILLFMAAFTLSSSDAAIRDRDDGFYETSYRWAPIAVPNTRYQFKLLVTVEHLCRNMPAHEKAACQKDFLTFPTMSSRVMPNEADIVIESADGYVLHIRATEPAFCALLDTLGPISQQEPPGTSCRSVWEKSHDAQ